MVFLMPWEKVAAEAAKKTPGSMTPREIVVELDKFIVGQKKAKKAVAVALRNRWRRQQLDPEMAREVLPKNILMIGPTGVGKTEVARRLARLAGAPFLKVEAAKFTEVGYVGRDAESMVRDLVDAAINMVRTEREDEVFPQAEARADERLLDLLLPPPPSTDGTARAAETGAQQVFVVAPGGGARAEPPTPEDERRKRSREKLRQLLADGKLDEREVEIEVAPQTFPMLEFMQPPQGMEGADINFTEMLQEMMPKRKKRRSIKV